MAAGKVCTGFSLPYVALYTASSGTITYTSGQQLARGVNVDLSIDENDDNDFWADNQLAESAQNTFTSGSVTLTVDGLKDTAEKLIMGLPAAGQDGWIEYGDNQAIPYVGVGYIARYQEEGVVTWTPTVLHKCRFNELGRSHATQEETIEFQTQELSAKIYRSDNSNHGWQWLGGEFTTEALALAALRAKLDIA